MLENTGKNKLLVEALPDTEKNLRTFGVGGAVIFLVIWLIGIYLFNNPIKFYLPGLASFLLITGLFCHSILRPVYKAWIYVAIRIGHVVTLTILFILYIFVMTPIGLIMRFSGRDALSLKFNKNQKTYWLDHEQVKDQSRYLKEF